MSLKYGSSISHAFSTNHSVHFPDSQVDPWWTHLLSFAVRNKAYIGPDVFPSIDSSLAFSRIEEEWLAKNQRSNLPIPVTPSGQTLSQANGDASHPAMSSVVGDSPGLEVPVNADDDGAEDNSGFIIAGSVARETLLEDH
jgi:helicase MOV-10